MSPFAPLSERVTPRRARSCANVIEVSTTGWDPDRNGIGSTWMPGSPQDSRLFVPQAPTSTDNTRYLFALCGHNVPAGQTHRLVSYRQKLVLGAEFSQGGNTFVKELPVTTPDWSFDDGNVCWCFRVIPGKRQVPTRAGSDGSGFNVANQGPSRTNNPYGAYCALLYVDGAVARYVPPASGQPPGFAVEGTGTIFDVRNPWTAPNPIVSTDINGPCDLIMYASVRQSDLQTRTVWVPPPGFDLSSLVPEDRFLAAFPNAALYRHIAGAMTIEILR